MLHDRFMFEDIGSIIAQASWKIDQSYQSDGKNTLKTINYSLPFLPTFCKVVLFTMGCVGIALPLSLLSVSSACIE